MSKKIQVTVWNENVHEREHPEIAAIYPKGIHGKIADHLNSQGDIEARTATLEQPEHGLTDEVLNNTEVLYWWAHVAHGKVDDKIVAKVHKKVLNGMGLIVLHSGHFSKIFRRVLGTNCSLKWREAAEKERLWNLAPNHPLTQGIGEYIELPEAEMYGEHFDIPEPERLIFVSWFEGGEVFRSGCTWTRGFGKIFYFRPGHESYPIYHNEQILTVLANAARWAQPLAILENGNAPMHEPLEPLKEKEGTISMSKGGLK